MKNLQVGEFKANFSEVLEKVKQGESFGIVYGKNKKLVAEINPPKKKHNNKKRKLGLLEGKVKYVFADNFKMTEEEFVNLGKK
jgi:antitoxin (DNA-binding transcriptional repressor) of toxin-antitoxin stability system